MLNLLLVAVAVGGWGLCRRVASRLAVTARGPTIGRARMDVMNEQIDERHPGPDWPIDDVIDLACRLAAEDAIGGLHVAIDRRPTYADLLRYRRRAERCGLTLTVAASSISLRPRHAATWDDELESNAPAWLSRFWHVVQGHLLGTASRGNGDRPAGAATAGETTVDCSEPPRPARRPPPATLLQWRCCDFRRLRDPALSTG
jgi:hypothetical protein